MRLSDNPVLRGVAWVYTWFFRAIPRLRAAHDHGRARASCSSTGVSASACPSASRSSTCSGSTGDLTFFTLDANELFAGIIGGILGLGLSEAAYMAEIARAGILSVDKGQAEAAAGARA